MKRRSISCCEGPVLVMRVLHRDAHLLQREHRVAPQVARVVEAREVEVAPTVEHLGALRVLEVEEFQLGADVEDIAHLRRLLHRARQHVPRVSLEGRAVGRADAAEHARHRIVLGPPGQHLERGGVGERQHVGFLGAAEPLDAAAVEAHAVGEGVFQLAGNDGERLHGAQHVGEPEAHEVHVAALDGLQHEVLVRVEGHDGSFLSQTAIIRDRVSDALRTHGKESGRGARRARVARPGCRERRRRARGLRPLRTWRPEVRAKVVAMRARSRARRPLITVCLRIHGTMTRLIIVMSRCATPTPN